VTSFDLLSNSGIASRKTGGPKCLTLCEQQYFVSDTSSQST